MLVISSYHQSFWQPDNSLPFTDTRRVSRVFCRSLNVPRLVPRISKNLSTKRIVSKKEESRLVSTVINSRATWSINERDRRRSLLPGFVSRSKVDHGSRFGRGMHGSIHSNRLFLEKRRLNENLSTHVAKPAWPMTAFDHGRSTLLAFHPNRMNRWLNR